MGNYTALGKSPRYDVLGREIPNVPNYRPPGYGEGFFAKNPQLWLAKLATERAADQVQKLNGYPKQTPHTYHNEGPLIFDENGKYSSRVP